MIELMIVVGIIGILVALTGPQYAKYQSKARQSEAKLALGAIFVLEQAFYSEYSAYAPSMDAIGYTPEGNKRFYATGFPSAALYSNTIAGYSGTYTTPYVTRVNFPPPWTTAGAACSGVATVNCPAANAAPHNVNDPQQFTACACGRITQAAAMDAWQITEAKLLRNILVGF